MFYPRNLLKNCAFFVPQYLKPMVFLWHCSNLFSILLILHTNGSTGKGARENLLSFYIVRKFFVSRVKNTKSSKFPPNSLYSKHGIDSLTKSLACSEAELLLGVTQNLIWMELVCCPRFSPKWMLDPESTPKTGPENGLRREGYPLFEKKIFGNRIAYLRHTASWVNITQYNSIKYTMSATKIVTAFRR